MPTDEDARRIAELERQVETMLDELQRQAAALQRLESQSGLSSGNEYATINPMTASGIVASPPKRQGPPSEGPIAELAAELGFRSMAALAKALKVNEASLRSWNHRTSVPENWQSEIDKLRAKRQGRNGKSK